MSRIAVVLFNLGGPDSPAAVRPFLFNLFNDPAIIRAPGPIRWLIAHLISSLRAKTATAIYAKIGGASPLLPNTVAQGAALAEALADLGTVKIFPAMRYWRPRSDAAAAEIKAFAPDEIVLLPLYPQFSTTTTGSSFGDWRRAAQRAGIVARTRSVCCYPSETGFIRALAELSKDAIDRAAAAGRAPRVLFSAHGLPKKIVDAGDPYQAQVEQTARALVAALGIADLDWRVCYQSRVGPMEWIGPSSEQEIRAAAAAGLPIVVVPIAFVSEHSETLVELDIEYRELAIKHGAAHYERAPAVATHPAFIAGLARLVRASLGAAEAVAPDGRVRLCAADRAGCALA